VGDLGTPSPINMGDDPDSPLKINKIVEEDDEED